MTSTTTTISLSSESSTFLSTTIHPELELDDRHDYSCGLLDFSILIPNQLDRKIDLDESNNVFYFNNRKGNGPWWTLNTYIYNKDEHKLSDVIETIENHVLSKGFIIKFVFDEHTMKYRFENPKTDLEIDGEPLNAMLTIFGFDRRRLYGSKHYWADRNIYPIDSIAQSIRVNCDLVNTSSSFNNGESSHTLHKFHPSSVIDYKMIERPHNHIYLPVGRQRICNINITVTDQDDKPIHLVKGARIICLIGIKKAKRQRSKARRNVDLSGLA